MLPDPELNWQLAESAHPNSSRGQNTAFIIKLKQHGGFLYHYKASSLDTSHIKWRILPLRSVGSFRDVQLLPFSLPLSLLSVHRFIIQSDGGVLWASYVTSGHSGTPVSSSAYTGLKDRLLDRWIQQRRKRKLKSYLRKSKDIFSFEIFLWSKWNSPIRMIRE